MDNDKGKQPDDALVETDDADAPIIDEGWAKVDIREKDPTPEADLPSDIQPSGG